MSTKTLKRQGSPLANPAAQLQILDAVPPQVDSLASFEGLLAKHGRWPLIATDVEVLQVNLGKLCNQTCTHCHVDAGPDRREIMDERTVRACLDVLTRSSIPILDITGGAPEMNPHFGMLVESAAGLGKRVIDRCNLTILLAPGYELLPGFLAGHGVEIVASLPCYLEENCDRQRGDGVFQRSIQALQMLNQQGYGQAGTGLELSLVYNPIGPSLPPAQQKLEADYRHQLRSRFGIEFTRLYALTNLPISRFLDSLLQSGKYSEYMHKLVDAFNPLTADEVMCRNTVSVDWQGNLYDCDFNQMLELPLAAGLPRTIFEFDAELLSGRPIRTARHCFGCTAGAGSSCQGALI